MGMLAFKCRLTRLDRIGLLRLIKILNLAGIPPEGGHLINLKYCPVTKCVVRFQSTRSLPMRVSPRERSKSLSKEGPPCRRDQCPLRKEGPPCNVPHGATPSSVSVSLGTDSPHRVRASVPNNCSHVPSPAWPASQGSV